MVHLRSIALSSLAVFLCACSQSGRSGPGPDGSDLPARVTFAADIAPILWTNCMPCHRPGHAGPFSLITYADARKKARTIRLVTGEGYMPPWPADTSYRHFIGERALTRREVALIARWVDQGSEPGDTASLPGPPQLPEDPLLGDPDLVVWLPDTFHIPGDAHDRFVIAKAPFELPADTFLRAVAFAPGNRRYVHHMNGALINYADGAKQDVFSGTGYIDAETLSGVDAFRALQLANDDGSWPSLVPSAVNYLPGLDPTFLPEGIGGVHLKRKGAFLLNSLHYGPSPRDTTDRSRFLLWFGRGPLDRPLQEIAMGSNHTPIDPPLHLEPGDVKTFQCSYVLPKDISAITVNPHMHLLGRSFLAYAVAPRGDTIPLVRIKDWDFRWQYAYTFTHMQPLRKGTIIHVHGTFANTVDNPDQPYAPPRAVTGTDSRFMRTTDEMLQFFINYVDFRPGDERVSLAPAGPAPPPRSVTSAAATNH